jgi:hypothetical protein
VMRSVTGPSALPIAAGQDKPGYRRNCRGLVR